MPGRALATREMHAATLEGARAQGKRAGGEARVPPVCLLRPNSPLPVQPGSLTLPCLPTPGGPTHIPVHDAPGVQVGNCLQEGLHDPLHHLSLGKDAAAPVHDLEEVGALTKPKQEVKVVVVLQRTVLQAGGERRWCRFAAEGCVGLLAPAPATCHLEDVGVVQSRVDPDLPLDLR